MSELKRRVHHDLDRVSRRVGGGLGDRHRAVAVGELAGTPEPLGGEKAAREQALLGGAREALDEALCTAIHRSRGERQRLADPRPTLERAREEHVGTDVHVVVGVDVRGLALVERAKLLQLFMDAVGDQPVRAGIGAERPAAARQGSEVCARAQLAFARRRRDGRRVKGLGEVQVQSGRPRPLERELGGAARVGHVHHRRRRADRPDRETVLDRVGALAKAAPVVGVDDQQAASPHPHRAHDISPPPALSPCIRGDRRGIAARTASEGGAAIMRRVDERARHQGLEQPRRHRHRPADRRADPESGAGHRRLQAARTQPGPDPLRPVVDAAGDHRSRRHRRQSRHGKRRRALRHRRARARGRVDRRRHLRCARR